MPQILLIDDNPTQLSLREAVLCEAGFTVGTASTADEALALLSDPKVTGPLRLILTDHVMPGSSGADFVRQLRRFSTAVAVVVMSGLAEMEDEYAGLNVSFLNKPCPPEELIRRIRAFLQQSG